MCLHNFNDNISMKSMIMLSIQLFMCKNRTIKYFPFTPRPAHPRIRHFGRVVSALNSGNYTAIDNRNFYFLILCL